MTGGPEVHADRVVFRLEDHGFSSVRLQQELQRPRSGPGFERADGSWELEYRRAQVDRMEYRLEADGDSFCDPHNPLRAPGAFGDKSVIEFPGYAPPSWLAAPDPGPAQPVAENATLWSPPDTDPLRPLAAARRPRRHRVRAPLTADAADRPCDRDEPDPALPRRAARPRRPRRELQRLRPLLAPARRAPPPARAGDLRRGHRREPRRALPAPHPLAAPRRLSSADAPVRARSSASAGTVRSRASRASAGSAASSDRCCTPGRAATPIPITLTCGAPEENLANNRAVATALRRQGHEVNLHVNRDAHNYVGWRDTLDPHLTDLLARVWG